MSISGASNQFASTTESIESKKRHIDDCNDNDEINEDVIENFEINDSGNIINNDNDDDDDYDDEEDDDEEEDDEVDDDDSSCSDDSDNGKEVREIPDEDFMMLAKRITIQSYSADSKSTEVIEAVVAEMVSSSLSIFTWEAAYVLATFIATNKDLFQNKCVMEIGAGTSLPSIIAAKVGASRVFATDRADFPPESVKVANACIRASGVESVCTFSSLDWTGLSDSPSTNDSSDKEGWKCMYGVQLPPVPCDIVIGSDIFYSSENFDDIFTIIAAVFISNPNAVFITTYKERSSKRSLIPYLDLYCMNAEYIPLESFLHDAHLSIDRSYAAYSVNNISKDPEDSSSQSSGTGKNEEAYDDDRNNIELRHFSGIFCLKIKLRPDI